MGVTLGSGDTGEQVVGCVDESRGFAGGVFDGGEPALAIDGQTVALATGPDHGSGVAVGVALDYRLVAVDVEDRDELTLAVVFEGPKCGTGECIEGAKMPASRIDGKNLRGILGGDGEFGSGTAKEGRPDPAHTVVVEVGHPEAAVGGEPHALRAIEQCAHRRAPVPGKPALRKGIWSCACERGESAATAMP